ncbi:hypothetical protein Tco_0783607, partial [Tanacetum coccineum]
NNSSEIVNEATVNPIASSSSYKHLFVDRRRMHFSAREPTSRFQIFSRKLEARDGRPSM